MENKRISKGYIIFSAIIVLAVVGWYYHTVNTSGQNKLDTVLQGKIFEYQVKVKNKFRPSFYIAFGTDKEEEGSLIYPNKKTALENINNNGELANQLHVASENHDFSWSTNVEGTVIEWSSGAALYGSLDDPMYPRFSISVDKISGIFKKTITGTSAFTSFFGTEGTSEVRLVQVGKVKE